MIGFRTGSQLYRFVTLLSTTGEYPLHSLRLLGNERMYREMTTRLCSPQTVRNSETGETLSAAKIVNISGKGKSKTVRLYKGALPILKWIDAEEYYMRTFRSHRFSGDMAHAQRNHRVAEAIAMFMRTGYEFREYKLPVLQSAEIRQVPFARPSFYTGRYIKQIGNTEVNKTMFTRMVGAVFAGNACYAVYNTRNAVMKWNGKGECKAKYDLAAIARLNAGIPNVDSAILFGESDAVALATLEETERNHRLELRFDGVYEHIHFVPLSEIGMRQLALLTVTDWREQILNLLFESEQRSYDRGAFEYDACVDGVYVLSFLDGDIARLNRFRRALENRSEKTEVLCFEDQVDFLKKYLQEFTEIRVIGRDVIESELHLKK